MKIENFNINILYWIVGFVMGFLIALCSLKFSNASSNNDINYMITEYKLAQKKGYEFVCLYDTETKKYKLIEYADSDAYFTDDIYYVNQPYMCNLYYWNLGVWEPITYGIENYEVGENENLIYASSDLKDAEGGVYFYKTNSIITNPIFQGINTQIVQKINQAFDVMIVVGIVALTSLIAINLIPKVLYKFM